MCDQYLPNCCCARSLVTGCWTHYHPTHPPPTPAHPIDHCQPYLTGPTRGHSRPTKVASTSPPHYLHPILGLVQYTSFLQSGICFHVNVLRVVTSLVVVIFDVCACHPLISLAAPKCPRVITEEELPSNSASWRSLSVIPSYQLILVGGEFDE